MEKVDYSHLMAKEEAPVLSTYSATITLNIHSETEEIAEETLELLAKSFNHFSDIEVTKTEFIGSV